MPTPTIRNYHPQDLHALVELINTADRVDGAGYATTEAALAHRMAEPDANPLENVFVAEQDGSLVGYVTLYLRPEAAFDRIGALGIVHPGWRRQGIGTALMQRATQRAQQLKRERLTYLEMSVRERVAGTPELAQALGLQPVRFFYYMECHDLEHLPEPAFPSGIGLRHYALGQDEEAFVPAYNDGFSDHWGYVPHTLEKERHRVHAPGFRAEDSLLAVDIDGTIAGLCLLLFPKIEGHAPSSQPPVIDDLAVAHAYRQRGIGRALLLAGMRRIRDEGFAAAALAVDTDNPNKALRLYESVGFAIMSRSTAYRKELD